MTNHKIAPSLLAADFLNLGVQLEQLEQSKAALLHLDIMDGSFVPPISYGEIFIEAVKRGCSIFREVHLMVDKPEDKLASFTKAGAQRLIIHVEAAADPAHALKEIRSLGVSPGISLNPATPIESIYPLLPLVDLVLVMTVNPGWGGQKLIEPALDKVRAVKNEIKRLGLSCEVEVDGGVNTSTIKVCADAGADIFVAGTAVFGGAGEPNQIQKNVEALLGLIAA